MITRRSDSSVSVQIEPDLSIHRCAALTAAGLFKDAMHEAEAAIGQLDQIHGRPTKRAELLLTAAKCAHWPPANPRRRLCGPPRRAGSSIGRAAVGGGHMPSWRE